MKTVDRPTRSKLVVLLMGPPGAGKTTFCLQWPDVWIADCDGNLAGPTRYLQSVNKLVPFRCAPIQEDENGNRLPSGQWWLRLVGATREAISDPSIKTLVFDSLTQIDNMLVEHTMQTQGTKVMEIQHWRPFRQDLHEFIMRARTSGKNVIITCHEEIVFDKKGAVEKFRPTISTKISDFFGYYFTDIWRCVLRDVGGGKYKSFLITRPTGYSDLKNSLLLPPEIEASYEALRRYVEET